ncbi:MAG: hypothetical protein ABJN75_08660 [Hoeflea sp.]|uniref:hypothetical protein n=1 Tax=Hoeflea sp. TaxID=1940281 RepID=UPI003298EB22
MPSFDKQIARRISGIMKHGATSGPECTIRLQGQAGRLACVQQSVRPIQGVAA